MLCHFARLPTPILIFVIERLGFDVRSMENFEPFRLVFPNASLPFPLKVKTREIFQSVPLEYRNYGQSVPNRIQMDIDEQCFRDHFVWFHPITSFPVASTET